MSLAKAIDIVRNTNCNRLAVTTYDKDFVDAVKQMVIEELNAKWERPRVSAAALIDAGVTLSDRPFRLNDIRGASVEK